EHGRRGLGTRLVQAVIAWAQARGFGHLVLMTFRHLPWNAPFYRKLGFLPVPHEAMGPGLAGLFDEEAQAGIDPGKRIAMWLALPPRPAGEPRAGASDGAPSA